MVTNISEEPAVSIFRVEEIMFFQNICSHLQKYTVSYEDLSLNLKHFENLRFHQQIYLFRPMLEPYQLHQLG
jgi:hypothetical protein